MPEKLSDVAVEAKTRLDARGRVFVGRHDAVKIPEATELVNAGLARWEAPLAAHGRNARVLRRPADHRTVAEFMVDAGYPR